MNFEIKHFQDGSRGRFYLVAPDQTVGEMTYRVSKDVMYVDHVVVSPAFRGQGLGQDLVQAGVEFAREQGVAVRPICSYAQAVMDGNTAFSDVLA